jgi:hypothetical protein
LRFGNGLDIIHIGEVRFTACERIFRDDWIPLVVMFAGMLKVDIVVTVTQTICGVRCTLPAIFLIGW